MGEFDPFDQCSGRGLMSYTAHSKERGAYLGYWQANLRHGLGISVNVVKKTFYYSRWYIDEEVLKEGNVENHEDELEPAVREMFEAEGYTYKIPVRKFDYVSDPFYPLFENDTVDGVRKDLEEQLESLQFFSAKDDDVTEPVQLDSDFDGEHQKTKILIVQTFNLMQALRKHFVPE